MPVPTPLVARLQRTTFGILGLGRIGTAACLRAKAFGWDILFYDPYLPNGVDKSLGIERTKDLKDLFRRSSIVSIHCPCTRETRGMVGYELLSLMERGSVLVNTGRGEVVELDAVERCLREGILAGAGLDVLPEEPIPEPPHGLIRAYREKEEWLMGSMFLFCSFATFLLDFARCADFGFDIGMVLTCHTAFYSPSSFVDIREKSAQTMRDVLMDKSDFSNVITPEME
jgi:C-terminal binding protein